MRSNDDVIRTATGLRSPSFQRAPVLMDHASSHSKEVRFGAFCRLKIFVYNILECLNAIYGALWLQMFLPKEINQAWNFIFERERPFSFCKGHFYWKPEKYLEHFCIYTILFKMDCFVFCFRCFLPGGSSPTCGNSIQEFIGHIHLDVGWARSVSQAQFYILWKNT